MVCQRAQGQTLAHGLLVLGVNVVRVAGVDRDGQAGVGHTGRRERLRLARLGPLISVNWRRTARLEGRKADDVERKISLAEELSPVGDHHRKNSPVLKAAWRVLLALVPECAGDGKRRDGLQHPFVKNGGHDGPVLVGDG